MKLMNPIKYFACFLFSFRFSHHFHPDARVLCTFYSLFVCAFFFFSTAFVWHKHCSLFIHILCIYRLANWQLFRTKTEEKKKIKMIEAYILLAHNILSLSFTQFRCSINSITIYRIITYKKKKKKGINSCICIEIAKIETCLVILEDFVRVKQIKKRK